MTATSGTTTVTAASPEALSMAERATYAQPDEHGI
jgi:hypothetical protein